MKNYYRKYVFYYVLCVIASGCTGPVEETEAPKNVILFIGDGMGPTTVTAARIFDGQSRGESGEENVLSFEEFPHVALVKTYNTNQQVPDSAGTATAIHSGVKTRAGVIAVSPSVKRGSCAESLTNSLPTVAEIAKAKGIGVGIVTTTRLTHATPATLYAHSAERNWENDSFLSASARQGGCRDIAHQLIEFKIGDGLDVAMGGGRREFVGSDLGGLRQDSSDNLIQKWINQDDNHQFVQDRSELFDIDVSKQVLGLFAKSHMTYIAERTPDSVEPTLTEMTVKALQVLQNRENGYYLLVEGGRIDHGHHDGKPGYAMLETQEFARAIQAAVDIVDLDNTLVMVTADHSHVMTIAGYPTRGNPILGHIVSNDSQGEPRDEPSLDIDGNPYPTLAYINGPAAAKSEEEWQFRPGLLEIYPSLVAIPYQEPDGSTTYDETHGGEDVALYAVGYGSELVGGVIEQNKIYNFIAEVLFNDGNL